MRYQFIFFLSQFSQKQEEKKKTISLPPYNLHENNICQTILQQRAKHLLECLNGRKLLQEV